MSMLKSLQDEVGRLTAELISGWESCRKKDGRRPRAHSWTLLEAIPYSQQC